MRLPVNEFVDRSKIHASQNQPSQINSGSFAGWATEWWHGAAKARKEVSAMMVVAGGSSGKLQTWRALPPEPYVDFPETIPWNEA